MDKNDITSTGALDYRELQQLNQQNTDITKDDLEFINRYNQSIAKSRYVYEYGFNPTTRSVKSTLSQQGGGDYWGKSMFDNDVAVGIEADNLGDIRAENQPRIAKLGAGITKGVALVGTTFIDGTAGLLVGTISAMNEGISGGSFENSVSKLFDNDLSNSIAQINEAMEKILPNYRTHEEQNNEWWQNLGTVNFWADSFLKNLGFTVGAVYSGASWTKALKAINLVKGPMGAKAVGSVLSALNEGRIEANHATSDIRKLEYQKIEDIIRDREKQLGLTENSGIFVEEEKRLKEEVDERVNNAGLTTLIGNTVLLSLNNFSTFGNIYAKGFKNARTIAGNRVTKEALKEGIELASKDVVNEELGKNIAKEGSKYLYKKVGTKKALARGLKHGLVEGNEELAQAFIADVATNMNTVDSPDAYYEALIDPKAEIQTNDFLTSVIEGFANTYGNGDRYEEFAVGFLTGVLGVPTFGKMSNSGADTYIGRGRTIGITGGILGELGIARAENKVGSEAVKFMNSYVEKLQDRKGHFVRSQSFTNAMDGWAEANDAFEYKNAEDNNDFNAIASFASVGKLDDLKEMVNQDFENISDEELEKIAMMTSPTDAGGWRNLDDSLMSSSEEGRQKMRNELIKKRDKILSEIDRYEESIANVKGFTNNSLSNDQANELAWLNWKIGIFTNRYNSIKEKNKYLLKELQEGIQMFKSGTYGNVIDDETEEGSRILASMDNAEKFIEALQSSKSPLQLAALMEANPKLTEFIEELGYYLIEDVMGIDYATFIESMNDLKDVIRIAKATKSFNKRYKEFRDNPTNLIRNRTNTNDKKRKVVEAVNNVNLHDKVNNSSVNNIVKGIESGDLDISELDDLFSEEDNAFLGNIGNEEGVTTGKQKVEEAKNIIQTNGRLTNIISNLEDKSTDSQEIEDALTLLNNSKEVSESEQEMLDTTSQAYNDPFLLYEEDDSSMQGISQEEIASILDERIDAAKSIIEQAKAILAEENNELKDLPSSGDVERRFTVDEAKGTDKGTGHDTTVKVMSENERRKEEEKEETKKQEVEALKGKINDFFNEARQEVALENRETFDKALSEVINNIDMLLAKETPILELGKAIKNTESYKTLKQLVPTIDEFLNVYVTSKTKKGTITKQIEDNNIKTPIVNEEVVRRQTTEQMKEDSNKEKSLATYQYWKPTISYLPFGKTYLKGDTTPFYIIARSLKNTNGTPVYTEAQLRRIEAVGKYLEEHGAFKLVDSGEVKAGDKVSFTIDSTLNDTAGEIVILMSDSQGRIIGDVMSQNDASFQKQTYLPAFVEKVVQEYKDAGYPQYFTSSLTTVVAKNMVGKIPYLADHEEMNTINDIHSDGNTPIPFLIGVAASSGSNVRVLASAGRTKKQGQSDLERSINPPLVAKAGQPFLLMPTSSTVNHYMPVPIMMDPYSPSTQGTALGQAIHKVLERVTTADNSSAIDIIRDLEELISVQEIHINYSGDTVKVTIKPNGAEHQMTIYNGTKNAPNIVEQLELGLQGQPFQVSRKYMNEDYNGQDYNRMIGEVAKTNLPIGATHTVSDWFTLKPIDELGNITKAKSPRSTGKNPNAAELSVITVTRKGMQLQVNPKTWEISDGKKTYEGKNADKARALAFGVYTNQNMEQPYDTEWGYYDPIEMKFIEKPEVVERSLGAELLNNTKSKTLYPKEYKELIDALKGTSLENKVDSWFTPVVGIEQPSVQAEATVSNTELARKIGLLGNKVRESLWEALTPEQQSTIINKKGPKQKQWMEALEASWTSEGFNESKLKGSVDDLLKRKGLYRKTDNSLEVWNEERELKWLSKVLPNLSTKEHLRIKDGLIEIAESDNPEFAYGKFQDGIITISDVAASGTTYHEAFHAVVHTLLDNDEYQKLLDSAVEIWGDIDGIQLEENLAEDFRRFVQSEELWYDNLDEKNYGKVRRTLAILYHKLKNLVKELSGKIPYINRLYYSINRGKFGNKKVNNSDVTRFNTSPYSIKYFQEDIDSSVNNPYLYKNKVSRNGAWGKKVDYWKEKGFLIKGYYNTSTKKWTVSSFKYIGNNHETSYNRIEQYYRDKMMYSNLTQEDKNYLMDRGITIEEYNKMSQLEKEVLFKCKY